MRSALISIALVMLCVGRVGAGELFVAPNGDDAGSGSQESPFASLQRARDEIRTLKGRGAITEPMRVIVADGHYHLTEPLELSPKDSGTPDAPVTYQAADGARPVLQRRTQDSKLEARSRWSVDRSGSRCCQRPMVFRTAVRQWATGCPRSRT